MRRPKETVQDVPFLMLEWDVELNSQYGIFPQLLGSQSNEYAYWKCSYGHQWKAKINNRYNGRGCPECRKRKRTSFPEQAIFFYAKQKFQDAINSYKSIFNNGMELDIFIPSLMIGIEYDGLAWHDDTKLNREKEKYRICQECSIKLIRLKENEKHWNINFEVADEIIPVKKVFSSNTKDYSFLDAAIELLLSKLTKEHIDVDTKRDRKAILISYLGIADENSLQKLYPVIAAQWHPVKNGNLTPSMFTPHSSEKMWWIGDCGHEWEAPITVRTRGNNCPYCSGQKVLKGFNDLQTVCPEIALQWHPTKNNSKTPDMFTFGSGYRAIWLCPTCDQEWESRINMRTSHNHGCPYCAHIKPIKGTNDLTVARPDLMAEWNYEKNIGITPTELMTNSNKSVWWKCSKCKFEYKALVSNRNKGTGCKCCAGQVLISGKNDLQTLYPDIAKEWDYACNDCAPSSVFPNSNKKYHWVCSLGHKWEAKPNMRVAGRGCPICSGNKVLAGFNDLQTTHPEIANQWHPTKNQGLLPTQISKGYAKKVWFVCDACQNAYETYVGNKIKGYGKCPFCSKRKTRAKRVVQVETGLRFPTLKEAAMSIGKTDIRQIQMCCTGRCKTAYGFHWEYSDE